MHCAAELSQLKNVQCLMNVPPWLVSLATIVIPSSTVPIEEGMGSNLYLICKLAQVGCVLLNLEIKFCWMI